MKKKVYCSVNQQCKCIKFTSQPGISDINNIREKLSNAFKRDPVLSVLTQNKFIVIQKKEPVKNIWYDIDEDDEDEIENDSELNVLLLSTEIKNDMDLVTSKLPCDLKSKENSANVLNDQQNDTTKIDPQNVEVLFIEPFNQERDPLIDDDEILSVHTDQFDPAECNSQMSPDKNENSKDSFEINEGDTPETIDSTDSKKMKKKKLIEEKSDDMLFESCKQHSLTKKNLPAIKIILPELPDVPFSLNQKICNQGIEVVQSTLIAFYAQYLYDITKGNPRSYYQPWATKIVNRHEKLKCGEKGSEVVSNQLSSWVRNYRNRQKVKAVKRDHAGKKVTLSIDSENKDSNDLNSIEVDVEKSLKELKRRKNEADTYHIRRLMDITFSSRRNWIKGNDDDTLTRSIVDIINEFPHLGKSDLVLHEFYNIKSCSKELLNNQIECMFTELRTFYKMKTDDDDSNMLVLVNLYKELCTKKLKKVEKPLFVVEKACTSTAALVSMKTESPRVIAYFDEKKIAAAMIVADGEVKVDIFEPTATKIVACLIGCYYVWDVTYPKPYENALEYIDKALFNSTTKNTVIMKFERKVKNAVHLSNVESDKKE